MQFGPTLRAPATVLALLLLASCSGGGGGGSSSAPAPVVISKSDAARLLTQATYGVTDADVSSVISMGYGPWIDNQETLPQASAQSYMASRLTQLQAANSKATLSANQFWEYFWAQPATANDQLRERVKLAYSEMFVTSFQSGTQDPAGMGAYWDMLGNDAFVNFRTLLEDVTRSPQMGIYLTSLGNQKENPATGQHPDENYAREVMQLMTIGLYKLNADGTQQLDSSGNPIPNYAAADITGLAKVFTGMSWYSPTPTNTTFYGGNKDANAQVKPMIYYDNFHSISEKDFLGTTIPATTTANTAADIKTALDALFNHPNVGPFVGKHLIQSLVTSNPSPAYVGRVAAVFANNGSGVRGDMGAVVKAVLMDPEARDSTQVTSATFGKLREPVVRLGNWIRSFNATSQSNTWPEGNTSSSTNLAQAALYSPSVFNFWRPGYVPPSSKMAAAGLVAPEMQVVDEVSVAGYLNQIEAIINNGFGATPAGGKGADVQSAYPNEVSLAATPQSLIDRLNLLLFYGQMSPGLQSQINTAISGVYIPGGTATAAQIQAAELQRVKLAVFLSMAAPEYLAQR
jgi:uncharacterized protein (DUF1800 family)